MSCTLLRILCTSNFWSYGSMKYFQRFNWLQFDHQPKCKFQSQILNPNAVPTLKLQFIIHKYQIW